MKKLLIIVIMITVGLCCAVSSCADAIDAISVPILAYHDFSEDVSRDFIVSADVFESHLSALHEAGYTAISFRELIDYVYEDGELPPLPILIVSDDGYDGVVDIASPIADKYGMKLSCAVIGSLAGAASGHFSLDGYVPDNIEIVSHTYDLHDRIGFDGIVDLSGSGEYQNILLSDKLAFGEWCLFYPMINSVIVYPHGKYTDESEKLLCEMGYKISVTCDYGINEVRRSDPEALRKMRRITVWGQTTDRELMRQLLR